MISAQDSQILETFATQVRQHFPEARIWAFGSRARGEGTWESDLDVCVVLDRHDHYVDDIIDQSTGTFSSRAGRRRLERRAAPP